MWKSMLTNWTTSVPGLLATICESTVLLNLVPVEWKEAAHGLCIFFLAIAAFAAKSANVSHSGTNAEAHVVHNPVKVDGTP